LGGTPETLPPTGGSMDSVSAKGKENVGSAPALCISLAAHDGTFLSPADRLVCLGQEEVGAPGCGSYGLNGEHQNTAIPDRVGRSFGTVGR
jgi:hypothetical protein